MTDYFDRVWPLNRYDNQGTASCPYQVAGYDVKAVAFFPASTYPRSEAVIAYSESLNKEIVYISTRYSNKRRVVATDSDGNNYWTSAIFESDISTYDHFISLSNDAEQIYSFSTIDDGKLYCIDSNDGSTKWDYDLSTVAARWDYHGQTQALSIGTKIFFAHNGLRTVGGASDRLRYIYINRLTNEGSLEERIEVDSWQTGTIDNNSVMSSEIISNDDDTYIYFAYSIYLDSTPDTGRTALIKSDKDDLSSHIRLYISLTPGGSDLNMYPSGIAFNNNSIYITTAYGLVKVNSTTFSQIWRHNITGTNISEPAIDSNGIIYYKADNTLYAIQDNGSSYTKLWNSSIMPDSAIPPIIDDHGDIYVACNNSTGDNLYIFDSSGNFLNSTRVGSGGTDIIDKTPILGHYFDSNQIYYFPMLRSGTQGNIYLLHSSTPVTTTTTSSTTSTPTTTTTTTTPSTTTTTSTPSTTTTTTTLPPSSLSNVKTVFYELSGGTFVEIIGTNASDSDETINNVRAAVLSFGTLAPGETSKTMIVSLQVPYARAIGNIKLGLIDSGGITFANDIFGLTTSQNLRSDIEPSDYFQGINTNKSSTSPYNISISNLNKTTSQYVYLNIFLPSNHSFGVGIVKLKWFFDYSD